MLMRVVSRITSMMIMMLIRMLSEVCCHLWYVSLLDPSIKCPSEIIENEKVSVVPKILLIDIVEYVIFGTIVSLS
jgi:hypothetical protein